MVERGLGRACRQTSKELQKMLFDGGREVLSAPRPARRVLRGQCIWAACKQTWSPYPCSSEQLVYLMSATKQMTPLTGLPLRTKGECVHTARS
jgi:hypothetical protein